jgi:hypothetical protein
MRSLGHRLSLVAGAAALVLPSLFVVNCANDGSDDGPTTTGPSSTSSGPGGGAAGPGGSGGAGGGAGGTGGGIINPTTGGSGGTGGIQNECISKTVVGELVPLDMLILQDRSGSMTSNDKWEQAVEAIKGFADSPGVAGLNLGLAFFPPKAGNECTSATYENLPVDIAPLPGNASAIKLSLESTAPTGSTPMLPALEGALAAMTTYLGANPNHAGVVILVTDGDPGGCSSTVANVSAAAAAGVAATPAVRTFVIGMEGATFGNLDQIALAGGTSKSFDVSQGQSAQAELAKALEEVRKAAIGCVYVLPEVPPSEGTLDPASVSVKFIPGINEPPVAIGKVDALGDCGEISGGFYFDDNADPTQVTLCPASCESVQEGTENASVQVVLGCIEPPAD